MDEHAAAEHRAMRLAVGLPSLEPADPLRAALDAVLAALAAAGVAIEGFCEHDRVAQRDPFAVFHYLRMAERHAAEPFDLALYPLGRDAGPYQGVYAAMRALPGVVWFLDPVMHHFFLGGVALYDRWNDYRTILDDAYGDRGAAVAQTVASNWGTGALFRRYGLAGFAAASQPGVLAAGTALAGRLSAAMPGRSIGVVPLPPPSRTAAAVDDSAGRRRVAIMSLNESHATTAIRAAASVLGLQDGYSVSICVSRPVYAAVALPAARRSGIAEVVEWELDPSGRRMHEIAATHETLVWLAEELQATHRQVLVGGMAAGRLTVVPRTDLYDDLPDGAVFRAELGGSLAPLLAAFLQATAVDDELRAALSGRAREFIGSCPDAAGVARILRGELQRLATTCAPRRGGTTEAIWRAVAADFADLVVPGGASEATRRSMSDALETHTGTFRDRPT